jgi:transcriptional regulator with XRE-family HTH domain
MSQPELAAALEMSVASVRRIEQERRDVSTAELVHIGEVCGVPRKFMLYGWVQEGKSTVQSQTDALEGIIADMAKRIERHERLHELAAERLAKLDTSAPNLLADLESELAARKTA